MTVLPLLLCFLAGMLAGHVVTELVATLPRRWSR